VPEPDDRVAELLKQHGHTYASEAGIRLAPYVDSRMTEGARRAGLPADREALAKLLASTASPARLAAALVRVSLNRRAAGAH
jgi:hypothetical protein